MFYSRFCALCKERGISPTTAVRQMGLSSGNSTYWKNGRIPKTEVLECVAKFFGVSVDYLLGKTDVQTADKTEITSGDIKFALWGGDADIIDDEMLEDVKDFAKMILAKKKRKLGDD